jgi:hypothetical protein
VCLTVVPDERGRPVIRWTTRLVPLTVDGLIYVNSIFSEPLVLMLDLPGQAAAERITSEFPLPAGALSSTGVIPLHPLKF